VQYFAGRKRWASPISKATAQKRKEKRLIECHSQQFHLFFFLEQKKEESFFALCDIRIRRYHKPFPHSRWPSAQGKSSLI
jgi:hypothetical protein